MLVNMKYSEKRRSKIVIVIITVLFIRSLYLFLSKGMPLGFNNWKFYSSIIGALGFLILLVFSIKLNRYAVKKTKEYRK